jgi:hypothetical protein
MTMTFVSLPSTTTTAWYGHCGHCGLRWNNHKLGCPTLASMATFSTHQVDCRCPTCRPDLHITHPDTLACERSGCCQSKAQ